LPRVHVNGISLYYEVHGQGQPLVLIMGLRRNLVWWYRQLPELSRHFRVIVFDNRGAGRSDQPDVPYSIKLLAADTAGLMVTLGLGPAHVLGVSMGGYIAQELALAHPELVRGLILGCTSCGGRRAVLMSPELRERFVANEGLTPEQILRKDMNIYFSDRYIAGHPEEIAQFVKLSLLHYQPAFAFFRQLDACLEHDTVDRVGSIPAPTLIASGDDDPLVPFTNSLILQELMPRAKLEVFPGGRHCFFLEQAEEFNRMAVEFLKPLES
jgi:pimeloyl-ACP methyl ester carboxylesterase